MSSRRVSVIMAVHNGGVYLRDAVNSILAQTMKDFEFIIIDDGSTDVTPLLLREYEVLDHRIRLFRLDKNKGLTHCLNMGLRLSMGKYIARMDADDISLPNRFSDQIDYLDNHPEVEVLGTGFSIIDEHGEEVHSYVYSGDPSFLRWSFVLYNPIAHSSVMMRSSGLNRWGGYDDGLIRAQDYDLWWRISVEGNISNLQKTCLLIRSHSSQVSRQHHGEQEEFLQRIKQRHLEAALERQISLGAIAALGGVRMTAANAAEAGDVLIDYCFYCSTGAALPIQFKISWQAVKKTFLRLAPHAFSPVVLGVWGRFCLLLLRMFSVLIRMPFYSFAQKKG